MNLLKTRFTIDDFILAMLQVPPTQLQLEQLQDWIARLGLKTDLLDRYLPKAITVYCPRSGRAEAISVQHNPE